MRRGSIAHAVAERPSEGLERGLGEVVVVATRARHVDGRAGGAGERLDRVLDELEGQLAGALAAEREVDDRIRPPAEVDDRAGERLVHRHAGVAEAGDPGPVAERLRERRPEDEGHVLDRVVLVDARDRRSPEPRGRTARDGRATRAGGRRSRRRWRRPRARRRRGRGSSVTVVSRVNRSRVTRRAARAVTVVRPSASRARSSAGLPELRLDLGRRGDEPVVLVDSSGP